MYGYSTNNNNNHNSESSTGKLNEFLSLPIFEIQELFQTQFILGEIKSNFATFVQYMKSRKTIVKSMIYFMTRLHETDLKDQNKKKYCFYSTQILTYDDEALMQLFFESPQESIQFDKIEDLILIKTDSNETNVLKAGTDIPSLYEILRYFLDYLVEANQDNEACNAYFCKTLLQFVRRRGVQFIRFLENNPIYIDKIIEGMNSSTKGTILMKILNINIEPKSESIACLKQRIVKQIADILLQNLSDGQFCQGLCLALQEGFSALNSKLYGVAEDFTEAFKYLVSVDFIKILVDNLLREENGNDLESVCSILITLLKNSYVLNIEQIIPLTYFTQVVNLLRSSKFNNSTPYSQSKLIEMIALLSRNNELYSIQLDYGPIIEILVERLNSPANAGIIKTEIYKILKTLISKAKSQQLKLDFLQGEQFLRYFPRLASKESQIRRLNRDPNITFEVSLLLQLESKIENIFLNTKMNFGIDLAEIKTKYNKKLGGDSKAQQNNSSDDELPIPPRKREPLSLMSRILKEVRQKGKQPTPKIDISTQKNELDGFLHSIPRKGPALPNLRYMKERTLINEIKKINQIQGIELHEVVDHPPLASTKREIEVASRQELKQQQLDVNRNKIEETKMEQQIIEKPVVAVMNSKPLSTQPSNEVIRFYSRYYSLL